MSVRWEGWQIRQAVERAMAEADVRPTRPSTVQQNIQFERALEKHLEEFVDVVVCTDCAAICEEAEPE